MFPLRRKDMKNRKLIIIISAVLTVVIAIPLIGVYAFMSSSVYNKELTFKANVKNVIDYISTHGTPTIDELNNIDFYGNSTDDSTVTITFPEGLTVTEIAEKLEANGVCSKTEFLERVKNPSDELLNKLGITNKSERVFTLEGYIFPDTYEFYKGENVDSVIGRFTDNFLSKITDKDRARAEALGYTMDEILTIASIIQEEAGSDAQNGKVSSVLHNRLNTGTKIECDVTITYLEKHCKPYLDGGLTEDHKNNYNTYKCDALPKGPICNPGYACIKAALYPEATNYFYFVTDADWNYYYATTWDEHVANCHTAGIPGY